MWHSSRSNSRVSRTGAIMRRKFTTAEVLLLFVALPSLMLAMAGCIIGIIYYFFG